MKKNKNSILKGVILVGLGASSYGLLATLVKLAYSDGYSTAEVSLSQFIIGIMVMGIILVFENIISTKKKKKPSKRNIFHLIMAGTSLGATSIFYYLAVKHIPVSIAIVLLMQTVWMGIFIEMLLDKTVPSTKKILSAILAIIGTILATNLVANTVHLDWQGFFWGIMAAVSFSITMYAANRIATQIPSTIRSFYMLVGGTIAVSIFSFFTLAKPFEYEIFIKWGILLALFGTIIPPILMNKGFPLTGIGLGSIISVLELPISVLMAFLILDEKISLVQWLGIIVIIGAVVLMNIRFKKRKSH